jgi:hypothetical protein
MDLIDRYRKWRQTHSNDSDDDSGADSDADKNDNSDSEWDIGTIREPHSPYILEQQQPQTSHSNAHVSSTQLNGEGVTVMVTAGVGNAARAKSPVKAAVVEQKQSSPLRDVPTNGVISLDRNSVRPHAELHNAHSSDLHIFMRNDIITSSKVHHRESRILSVIKHKPFCKY